MHVVCSTSRVGVHEPSRVELLDQLDNASNVKGLVLEDTPAVAFVKRGELHNCFTSLTGVCAKRWCLYEFRALFCLEFLLLSLLIIRWILTAGVVSPSLDHGLEVVDKVRDRLR